MASQISAYVALTNRDWFNFLSARPELDEVNFWYPRAATGFGALKPGEPFLFKLPSPDHYIVGGGFFAYSNRLPLSLAWDAFGVKNGAATAAEMRERIGQYRRETSAVEDYEIGCILLELPFFFGRDEWIPVPFWKTNIQRGRTYPLTEEPGATLWQQVSLRLQARPSQVREQVEAVSNERYGEPTLVQPRLGQGTFRVIVTDAYSRRCAVTGERVLPVLEAAHIRAFSDGGENRVDNGLLLRSDAHTLFDRGYITVTPEHVVEVSKRLKSDFDNGEDYLVWHGKPIRLPDNPKDRPSSQFLQWHNQERFLG